MSGDVVLVSIPAGDEFVPVFNLVLGGLGSRFDLPFEQVDDLQLAVDSVLAAAVSAAGADVTLEIEVRDDTIALRVGPLADGAAADAGLKRVLSSLVPEAAAFERDGAGWYELSTPRPRAEVT